MYSKTKLKNGLNLILAPLSGTKAVTALVLLPAGSRHEDAKINGASHFIEHLLFKGTKKRPTSLDITKELDSVGAEFNAFTGKDHTGYYIKAAGEYLDLAFDILSDMIFNSVFDSAEIEKERGVIVEEINMYQDNPLMYVPVLFEQTIFPNSSLGRTISGSREIIRKITRAEILAYKDKFYQPSQMTVVVSGNFKKNQVLNLAKKYFADKKNVKSKNNFLPVRINQSKPRVGLIYKETEQVQICLGLPAYSLFDPKIYPLYLLAVILGGNMSSRLFASVREQRGLAYYIKADLGTYQDIGSLVIQAGLDKSRIKEAIILILAELKKIRDSGVTDKELKSAQEFLKGKLILEWEDSENVADWYGKQDLLVGKILTPEQKIKKIFGVDKNQVKQIGRDLVRGARLNLALIGPFKEKREFEKLLKF
jgi:predicted Zn-dependent peptidase